MEQFLTWAAIALGGPTLRAFVKGGWSAAVSYWSGAAAVLHLVLGLGVGLAMAVVFGILSWNRMERMYAEATAAASGLPGGGP